MILRPNTTDGEFGQVGFSQLFSWILLQYLFGQIIADNELKKFRDLHQKIVMRY